MNIVVSAVAFSKNKRLVEILKNKFPNCVINYQGKRYSNSELIEYFKNAEIIIIGLEIINEDLLKNLPRLKFISKFGVGLDNIDINACKKRNIQIGWSAGVNRNAVAEMTLGLFIILIRNIYITSNQLKNNIWNKSGGKSLSECTIGIIGLGNIGKELVKLLLPFNTKILVNDIKIDLRFCKKNNLIITNKEFLYKNSDIITLHLPLNNKTKFLINKNKFLKMKNTTYLVNTSRGNLVNQNDLKWALANNKILGAAIDVYDQEPPSDFELLKFQNLICTPHIAGNSNIAVENMGISAISHIESFIKKYNL
jgi:phosphoglycerate dehydrogenase-like enzyme